VVRPTVHPIIGNLPPSLFKQNQLMALAPLVVAPLKVRGQREQRSRGCRGSGEEQRVRVHCLNLSEV
jgi:hypothetical protein